MVVIYRLASRIPDPSARLPLSQGTFFADFVPIISCYYATAVLVLFPGTLPIRITLLPITLWAAFRAATTLDLAGGYDGPGLRYLNFGLCLTMIIASMRSIEWTICRAPLRRESVGTLHNEACSSAEDTCEKSTPGLKAALVDALDLSTNLRGIGWNWSNGLYVPVETRPTTSSMAFTAATIVSFLKHWSFADFLIRAVQYLNPTAGSTSGGTIMDPALSILPRYSQSMLITFIAGLCVYSMIQLFYEILTVVGILVFRQYPHQWQPLFDTPWKCTSLADFWAKGWHQVFRSPFITLGAKPLSALFGRLGGVMGAFLASALLHDLGMWGMGLGTDFPSVGIPFLMMGVGIILERAWKKMSGMKVGGFYGWLWTIIWVIFWCQSLVDAWCRRGLVGSKFVPEHLRPSNLVAFYVWGWFSGSP